MADRILTAMLLKFAYDEIRADPRCSSTAHAAVWAEIRAAYRWRRR